MSELFSGHVQGLKKLIAVSQTVEYFLSSLKTDRFFFVLFFFAFDNNVFDEEVVWTTEMLVYHPEPCCYGKRGVTLFLFYVCISFN